jgi:hypothetical protein
MDSNECKTMIQSARNSTGKPAHEILTDFDNAVKEFGKAASTKFGKKGESL